MFTLSPVRLFLGRKVSLQFRSRFSRMFDKRWCTYKSVWHEKQFSKKTNTIARSDDRVHEMKANEVSIWRERAREKQRVGIGEARANRNVSLRERDSISLAGNSATGTSSERIQSNRADCTGYDLTFLLRSRTA